MSSITGDTAGEPIVAEGAREEHRPLTVLQVVPRLNLGGVERGTLEVTEAITAAGGRAIIATAGGQLSARCMRAGGEIFEMNAATKNPFNILQNALILRRLIREEQVHVVHARSRAPGWSAFLAARMTGTAFVTTYHGTYHENLPLKRLYNSVMARGRPVIAISEFIRDLIVERHRVDPDRIVVIHRGADTNVFSEDVVGNERTAALAEAWGLLDDPRPMIMLPGRLTRWKGAETLIEAATRLKAMRGGADFLAMIVGDDGGSGYREKLEKRVLAVDAIDCIRLADAVSDMPAAYKLASVVVSASTEPEAFGRVAVEAQAMGRPVVATDHGGARETVVHGEGGWLYPAGDASALAAVLNEALEIDPSIQAHRAMAARARVHSRYTVGAMQRATLSVYEWAAGRPFGQTL